MNASVSVLFLLCFVILASSADTDIQNVLSPNDEQNNSTVIEPSHQSEGWWNNLTSFKWLNGWWKNSEDNGKLLDETQAAVTDNIQYSTWLDTDTTNDIWSSNMPTTDSPGTWWPDSTWWDPTSSWWDAPSTDRPSSEPTGTWWSDSTWWAPTSSWWDAPSTDRPSTGTWWSESTWWDPTSSWWDAPSTSRPSSEPTGTWWSDSTWWDPTSSWWDPTSSWWDATSRPSSKPTGTWWSDSTWWNPTSSWRDTPSTNWQEPTTDPWWSTVTSLPSTSWPVPTPDNPYKETYVCKNSAISVTQDVDNYGDLICKAQDRFIRTQTMFIRDTLINDENEPRLNFVKNLNYTVVTKVNVLNFGRQHGFVSSVGIKNEYNGYIYSSTVDVNVEIPQSKEARLFVEIYGFTKY